MKPVDTRRAMENAVLNLFCGDPEYSITEFLRSIKNETVRNGIQNTVDRLVSENRLALNSKGEFQRPELLKICNMHNLPVEGWRLYIQAHYKSTGELDVPEIWKNTKTGNYTAYVRPNQDIKIRIIGHSDFLLTEGIA